MNDITDISLNTTGNQLFLAFIIIAAVGFSYFTYRKTVPPVSTGLRTFLMTLRALAVILIVLLLFEPILSITRQKEEKPVVAVLVDRSASMGLADQKMNRAEELHRILQTPLFQNPPSDFDMQFYPFSYRLYEKRPAIPDSFKVADDGTDIRRALELLKEKTAEKYFAAVILVTDGANNLGENPARYAANYGPPIYPVAIGDSARQKDVLITNYVTNEIAYAENKIPVDVYLKSSGFDDKRVPVNLVQNNQTLDSKIVRLSGNTLEQKVRLYFTPQKEGQFKYEIKLPTLDGELTHINNSKAFYVKVLKSKIKAFVIAGGPSPDLTFLRRALINDEDIEVTAFVEKFKGRFYEGALPTVEQLVQHDCLIFVDYPRRSSRKKDVNLLKNALAKGVPALYFLQKNTDLEKLWQLKDFIPFAQKPIKGRERSVYIHILPQGLHHPILRFSENEIENRDAWQELPPVFCNINYAELHSSSKSLAGVDPQRSLNRSVRSMPLIVTKTTGQRKSATVLSYGLWRWDLLMWGIGKNNESYRRFLQNTIRWLVTQEDSKLVRIASNKEIYRSGEEIQFIAQVYFEDFKPVDGAEVTVQVMGGKETQELSLTNIGEGRYAGNLQVLQGGDYQFSGTAHQQGNVLGHDSGKFSVEEFSLEYESTRMNSELLRRIASESGGTYYTSADFAGLKEKLHFPEKYVVLKNEWEIWNKTPLLIACILLLSVEWFVRKRKGML
ncbi:MAG: hypothetical protein ACE5IR_08590 [bacterium]